MEKQERILIALVADPHYIAGEKGQFDKVNLEVEEKLKRDMVNLRVQLFPGKSEDELFDGKTGAVLAEWRDYDYILRQLSCTPRNRLTHGLGLFVFGIPQGLMYISTLSLIPMYYREAYSCNYELIRTSDYKRIQTPRISKTTVEFYWFFRAKHKDIYDLNDVIPTLVQDRSSKKVASDR